MSSQICPGLCLPHDSEFHVYDIIVSLRLQYQPSVWFSVLQYFYLEETSFERFYLIHKYQSEWDRIFQTEVSFEKWMGNMQPTTVMEGYLSQKSEEKGKGQERKGKVRRRVGRGGEWGGGGRGEGKRERGNINSQKRRHEVTFNAYH